MAQTRRGKIICFPEAYRPAVVSTLRHHLTRNARPATLTAIRGSNWYGEPGDYTTRCITSVQSLLLLPKDPAALAISRSGDLFSAACCRKSQIAVDTSSSWPS